MRRVSAAFVIVLALSIAPQATGQAPAEYKAQLDQVIKAHEEARQRWDEELGGKTTAEARKAANARYVGAVAKNTGAILNLVRAHPKDPSNVPALQFVIKRARAGPGDESYQAVEILLRDHVRDPGMGDLGASIFYFADSPAAESLLRAVLAQHPERVDRGRSCYFLAFYLRRQSYVVRRIRERPAEIGRFVPERFEAAFARFVKQADPESLEREAERLLQRIVAEFGDVADSVDHRPLGTIAEGELFAMRSLKVGKVAPEISGKDHDGRSFALSEYRDKVVVLTFSGNWCGPCVAMYPQERELAAKLKDKPFAIVSVNTDATLETLRKAIASGEITWRCWWDGGQTGPITTRWGVRSFPSIFVLDRAGVIRSKDLRGEELEKAVAALLDAVPPEKTSAGR